MRLSTLFVILVSGGLAAASHHVGRNPTALTQPSPVAELDALNRIAARFGQTTSAMIVAHAQAGTVLDKAPLEAIDALSKKLRTSGACKSVFGLAQLPHIVPDGDDGAEIRDLIEGAPANETEHAALVERVRTHPNGVGELISEDLRDTMIICPLIDPSDIAKIEPLVAGADTAIEARLVGPLGLAKPLAADLMMSAGLFFVLGTGIVIVGRKTRFGLQPRALAAVVALQALVIYVAYPWLWGVPAGLQGLLGVRAASAQQALDRVTGAEHLALCEVTGDFKTSADVARLDRLCAGLVSEGWQVSCPTQVLRTMSQALAGTTELPKTDEQLKALWFFGGDRPELSLVYTAEKRAALLRVRTPDGSDLEVLDRALAKHAQGLTFERAGIPHVDRRLHGAQWPLLGLFALIGGLMVLVGRKTGADHALLGQSLVVPSLLIKVGVVSRVLLAVGLLVLLCSMGARSKIWA